MRQIIPILFLLVLAPSALQAHHIKTLEAVGHAIHEKDFTKTRVLFSDNAWEGADGGISVETLEGWLRDAKRRMFVHRAGEERLKTALAMGIKFYTPSQDANPPNWLYILMVPRKTPVRVHIRDQDLDCKWEIVRLTHSVAETEKFLGERPNYLEERAKKWESRERERNKK